MKIYIGHNGNVDFDAPVKMTEEQYQRFLSMMRKMFAVVIPENVSEHRIERLGDKMFWKTWDLEEYVLLFDAININSVCERLGRTWMSVDLRRGEFIPDFMIWARIKGIDIFANPEKIRNLVEEYLEDKDVQKELLRQQRSKISSLKRKKKETENEMLILQNEIQEIKKKQARGKDSLIFKNKLPAMMNRLKELSDDIVALDHELQGK